MGLRAASVVVALALLAPPASAQNVSAWTFTTATDGAWIRTQDAYEPSRVVLREAGLRTPEDLFIRGGSLYVADTGNGRIVVLDLATGTIREIGAGLLDAPQGVFVDDRGTVFVADAGRSSVVVLDPDGRPAAEFGRPANPLFGTAAPYQPRKVAVDRRGTISVASEGSFNGLIQLDRHGGFLGYFGANRTSRTLREAVQDVLYTPAQKARLFHRIPRTFTNVAIDARGLIYTLTQAANGDAVKKHNTAGTNVLQRSGHMRDEANFVDLAVGRSGQIYAVSETGLVYEYDADGSLLFSFGGRAISSERAGLFTVASGIAVDDDDGLYILDRERGIVQVFRPTPFADLFHEASALFQAGRYAESKALWARILALNGVSRIAHLGLGRTLFQEQEYAEAARHFRIADAREEYSEAWWQLRNAWLTRRAGLLLGAAALAWLAVAGLRLLDRRTRALAFLHRARRALAARRFFADLGFAGRFITHPLDSFAAVRRGERGSLGAATVFWSAFLAVFAGDTLLKGYLFRAADPATVSPPYLLAIFLAPAGLWVLGSYLVSTISGGEGTLRAVYIASGYAFSPYVLMMPFVVALSHGLTLNESFLVRLPTTVLWTWSAVLLFFMVKEVHDYLVREAVRTVLVTLFFMAVIVLAGSILWILGDQMAGFVFSVIQEASYRAGT